MKRLGLLICTAALAFALPAHAQRGAGRAAGAAPANVETEEGIPVTDALVIKKCGTCHAKDDKGNLSRISWERSTPEGWSEALKRMVRLNGLTITPEEARSVVKYLSTYHGLSPEEAKPVMYIPEHRLIDETNIPNEAVRGACTTCHAMGRPMSWRRSKNDWKLLANLHVALYAQADAHFRRANMPGGGGAGAGAGAGRGAAAGAAAAPTQEPLEVALDFLGTAAALHTPEWETWRTRMRSPKLAGTWSVKGHLPGKGDYFGELVIEPGPADDEFKTKVKITSVNDGSVLSRTGTGLVYAGYSWRGRSQTTAKVPEEMKPDDTAHVMREAIWFSPDQSRGEGRWFWGEYQEFGLDVTLTRVTSETHLTGLDRVSLKVGTTGSKVKVFGDHIPADLKVADLDFGAGVKVTKIVSHTASDMVVEVDVDAKAASGKRDVMAGRAILPGGLAIYDKVDYIRVLPETSLARLGSDVHPKGYQQFEVMAYHRGADGKAHTADDIELGPVDVKWSVEEFLAVYGDDDKDFVGRLSETAMFTPAIDGPNPERKFSRNNYGDVWVVATAKDLKDKDGKPMIAKSYLLVTVPTYIKWDQPEVEK